jgi:hypothetical protein
MKRNIEFCIPPLLEILVFEKGHYESKDNG